VCVCVCVCVCVSVCLSALQTECVNNEDVCPDLLAAASMLDDPSHFWPEPSSSSLCLVEALIFIPSRYFPSSPISTSRLPSSCYPFPPGSLRDAQETLNVCFINRHARINKPDGSSYLRLTAVKSQDCVRYEEQRR